MGCKYSRYYQIAKGFIDFRKIVLTNTFIAYSIALVVT